MSRIITALYDFRSKQNYIYKTNKMKEISGASDLMKNLYGYFLNAAKARGLEIGHDLSESFSYSAFQSGNKDGQVIYEGGGNLYILYKSRDIFEKANKIFSRMVIEKAYDLCLLVSGVESNGNFNEDRKKLYEENMRKKNTEFISVPCNTLPYTQVDPNTFLPIVRKEMQNGKLCSESMDSYLKRREYEHNEKKDGSHSIHDINKIAANEGRDSLIAVIYTDGNKIGDKVKNLTQGLDDYDGCVRAMRGFSEEINDVYVKKPLANIAETLKGHKYPHFRQVLGGGDEITIICNARAAADVVCSYYESLKEYNEKYGKNYHACTGIAVCHSADPFSEVYKIAEACCESAKKKCRGDNDSNSDYIDFHFCHSGILGDFEQIRTSQEQKYTARPYSAENFKNQFLNCKAVKGDGTVNRSDVKGLGEAIAKGDVYYGIEIERLKSKYRALKNTDYKDNTFKKTLFDISEFYDLWFASGVEDEK